MTPTAIQLEVRDLFIKLKFGEISEETATLTLDSILKKINNLQWENFQKAHTLTIQELQDFGFGAFPLLLKFLLDHTKGLASVTPIKRQDPTFDPCGKNKYFAFYRKAIGSHKNGIRLSTFSIPNTTKKETEQYKAWTISLLNETVSTPSESEHEGNLVTALSLLALLKQLSKKTGKPEEFYFYCDSLLDRLVRDGRNQDARDIAEEVIACSISDNLRQYGHWCKMSLINRQKNPIEAALNGCLMFKAIQQSTEIPEQSIYRILKALLILFRDCGLLELLEDVKNTINSYDFLDQYDKESLVVMSINDKLRHAPSESAQIAENYASQHLEAILKRGKPAIESWHAIICNLINHVPNLIANHPSLSRIFSESESILGSTHTKKMRGMILSDQSNTKEVIISSINRLHSTRNKSDHIHEINLLQLTASNLITKSLSDNDIEGILIGHRVKSDGALAFKLSPDLPSNALIKFKSDETREQKINSDFYDNCLKTLSPCTDTKFIWIGENKDNIYTLALEDGAFNTLSTRTPLDTWSEWIKNELPNFGFDDTPRTGLLETKEDIWRDESLSIKSKLPSIELKASDKKAVVFADIETSRIPHNLMFTPKDTPQAICNSLTLDLYQSYIPRNINTQSLSIWAPLTEQDVAIQIAHAKLTDYFPTQNTTYYTDSTPPKQDHSDIRAFVCHGGRNEDGGFNGLYPSHGKVFTSNHIFGSGKLAILFVCHGGHIHPSKYARTLQTLTKTLLLDGYESVISPAWSLNVVIPGPWLSAFTTALSEGNCISLAVQSANSSIKEIYPVETAWGAMHLFGNPHIKSSRRT